MPDCVGGFIIIVILFVQKSKMQTRDMDVEQDAPGSDKLLRWPLSKEYVTHKYTKYSNCTKLKVLITKQLKPLKKSGKIDLVD